MNEMTAHVLDGRKIARAVRDDLSHAAARRRDAGLPPAGLAIVRAGEDAASDVYTHALVRTSARVGVEASVITLPFDTDNDGLRGCIEALNQDERVHGILVALPLPGHLSQRTVAEVIDARKDVDGISLRSAGNLFLRLPSFVPSTAAAVLEIMDRSGIDPQGQRTVIVGASNVVGKPLAFLLVHRDATVTVCHIYTRDLRAWTLQADILITAAGKPGLITPEMVKPGCVVLDVGINVREDGSIVGDVDYEGVRQVAAAITPVPGGVGQLTNLMLLKQTLLAAGEGPSHGDAPAD